MEEKNGVILSVSGDGQSGKLKDDFDGMERDFKNPALLELVVGGKVIYLVVITPKGEITIVKDVRA